MLLPRSPPPRPCTLPSESGASPNVCSLRSGLGRLGPCWPASTRTPADPRHGARAHCPLSAPGSSHGSPHTPTPLSLSRVHPSRQMGRAHLQGASCRIYALRSLCLKLPAVEERFLHINSASSAWIFFLLNCHILSFSQGSETHHVPERQVPAWGGGRGRGEGGVTHRHGGGERGDVHTTCSEGTTAVDSGARVMPRGSQVSFQVGRKTSRVHRPLTAQGLTRLPGPGPTSVGSASFLGTWL